MEQKGNNSAEKGCELGTRFDARRSDAPAALAHAGAALRAAGATPATVARVELILEELFLNSVLHGYRGDSASPVWIAVRADGFCYVDEAPPFNPLEDGPAGVAPDPALTIEDQPVGGAGLLLIRQLARQASYCRQDGRNCLIITV
ncbi:MAG: ATP-binding protein [Pseudomonadota bacterium]